MSSIPNNWEDFLKASLSPRQRLNIFKGKQSLYHDTGLWEEIFDYCTIHSFHAAGSDEGQITEASTHGVKNIVFTNLQCNVVGDNIHITIADTFNNCTMLSRCIVDCGSGINVQGDERWYNRCQQLAIAYCSDTDPEALSKAFVSKADIENGELSTDDNISKFVIATQVPVVCLHLDEREDAIHSIYVPKGWDYNASAAGGKSLVDNAVFIMNKNNHYKALVSETHFAENDALLQQIDFNDGLAMDDRPPTPEELGMPESEYREALARQQMIENQ